MSTPHDQLMAASPGYREFVAWRVDQWEGEQDRAETLDDIAAYAAHVAWQPGAVEEMAGRTAQEWEESYWRDWHS